MATEAQYVANRRNAQLSTGPTEEGKKASRMKAYRHGFTRQLDVRTPEDQEAHHKFCTGILSSLAPAEGVERQFAQSIAEDRWRLNRARSIENNIFTLACSFTVAQARSVRCDADFEEDSSGETESPEIGPALAGARTFQAIRHAVATKEKASPFHAQLAEMEGVPCENGFVSPTAEIAQTSRGVSPPERSRTCRILLIEAHRYASPHDRSLAGICRR